MIEDQDLKLKMRVDLAAAHRLAARFGFDEGICNHFTALVPNETGQFYLAPYGLHWSEIRASDLMVMDLDGNIVSGCGSADETAVCIHAPMHRLLPHAKCILHTHMPFATALAMLEDPELNMAGQSALIFKDIVAYDETYAGIALDVAEGERLAKLLQNRSVLFMANHGVLVAEQTIAQAFEELYYLERACQAQVYALSTGRKLKLVPEPVASKAARQIRDSYQDGRRSELHFSAWKRLLDQDSPGYVD